MVGWHHGCNGHESEHLWELVKDRGAWGAAAHGVLQPMGCEELDTTL